jgi:hypothetical protein
MAILLVTSSALDWSTSTDQIARCTVSYTWRDTMSRLRTLVVTGSVALVGVALAAPSAGAQPPPEASCLGVLSSFAGQAGIRDEFAPPPVSGQRLATVASEHGDFGFCLAVFLGP